MTDAPSDADEDDDEPRAKWRETCRFWAAVAHWTADEAVSLSFVADPRKRDFGHLQSRTESGALNRIGIARMLTTRALEAGELPKPTPPLAWIEWAERQDAFEFGPTLVNTVREHHARPARPERPESKRQIDNMAAVIAAMAVVHYGFDPSKERSPGAAEIETDVLLGGAKVGAASIRSYLRHGATELSKDGRAYLKAKAHPLIRKRKSSR